MVAVARGGTGTGVPADVASTATAVPASSTVPPFQDFLEANRATVYRFLTVAVGPADADDCFQETFLSALRAYPRVTRGERLDRGSCGSRRARRSTTIGPARRSALPTAEPPERSAPAVDLTPDDELWEAVRALPPRQRVAVVHRHVLDRPYPEIAELMGSTEEAARANVSQGIKKLRELIR